MWPFKKNVIEITVTEEHLDKAIAERPELGISVETCLMAQAVRSVRRNVKDFGINGFWDGSKYWIADKQGVGALVCHFDARNYDIVRESLPKTFVFTKVR